MSSTSTATPIPSKLIGRPAPEPGPGEIAVEVRAAAANPVDWKIRAGLLGEDRELPAPMGQEVSGVVTALGQGVEDFAVGEAVLGTVAPGYGGFAEHTLLPAGAAVAKPDEISFVDAATIPVAAATAYDGTHQIALEAGQTLLILGIGGGVGLMAAQIGRVHKFVVIVSAADPVTASELGGHGLQPTPESLQKITEVIEYGLVDPHVTARYPLERAGEAIAVVESGHATGKVVIEIEQR